MSIEIDNMNVHTDIQPTVSERGSRDESSGGPDHSSTRNVRQLKEVLRPVVMELIAEELASYMRMRG